MVALRVRTSLDHSAFLVDLAATAERAGLPVEQIHTEYGHDQLEVSLAPTTPVAAADTVAATRIVIGRAAAQARLAYLVRPVPFDGEAGNGAHLHLSLADGDGPLFSGGDGPYGMRPAGASAIAGVLQTLPDLLGVYAGSVLSSARLKPGNWAGAARAGVWRTAKRQCDSSRPPRAHRTAPTSSSSSSIPSANPYLAAARSSGARCAASTAGSTCPPRCPKDPPKAAHPPPMLQTDQETAIKALESSPIAADLLTPAVIEGLVAVRRYEITTYGDRPPAETTQALRLAWSC